ncbi:flavin-binding protein [Erythrobacter sp. GH3-10]|uniref:Flavin-binding protein n=2 Tax=Aurantiacibacter rhizosphaerae TaxID=2691582 RepID=A0A844XI71_9SPHN|nr:flavin-binding protein [Aurantiacibacter rhizosphaerae]
MNGHFGEGRDIETLDNIRLDIAARLNEGATNRRSALHTPIVATADADARVMVLRAFEEADWRLRFHTDARAPKAGVIGEGAQVGVLFYDREAKLQLRCRGRGWIETDTPLVDAAWEASDNYARRCYLGEGPGAVSSKPTSGLPTEFEGVKPTDAQLAPAREHFAILLVELEEADWFSLAHDGHKRAIFDLKSGEGRWVSP